MRVIIDWDLCRGHGQCMGEVPEVFAVDPSGRLRVLQDRPARTLQNRLEVAARYCPTGAIRLEAAEGASDD
jgi:sterol 14-demethylase